MASAFLRIDGRTGGLASAGFWSAGFCSAGGGVAGFWSADGGVAGFWKPGDGKNSRAASRCDAELSESSADRVVGVSGMVGQG